MKSIRELFAEHSLRCTQQRMAVYGALRDTKAHPTAEELFRIVQARTDRMSLATVYNSLEALYKARLVRKMPMTNGSCRYDVNLQPHLHVRFPATAEIEDVPEDLGRQLIESLPQDVLERIGRRMAIEIDGVSVQLLARRGHDSTPEKAG